MNFPLICWLGKVRPWIQSKVLEQLCCRVVGSNRDTLFFLGKMFYISSASLLAKQLISIHGICFHIIYQHLLYSLHVTLFVTSFGSSCNDTAAKSELTCYSTHSPHICGGYNFEQIHQIQTATVINLILTSWIPVADFSI